MNQKYQCPECGYVSDEPGDCPTCNVPLEPINGEEELEEELENEGFETEEDEESF